MKLATAMAMGLILAVATSSQAAMLTADVVDLGGGLNGFIVKLDTEGAAPQTWALELVFTGDIQQQQAFGGALPTNTEAEANTAAAIDATYNKDLDTWYYGGRWPANNPGPGGSGVLFSAGQAIMNVGSGLDPVSGVANVIHIVAAGPVSYEGKLFNAAGNVPVAGEFVPEPATMALLGLGGLVALRRRRAA